MPTIDEAIASIQNQLGQQRQTELQHQVLNDAARIGLTSLGVGVGGRGLWGLMQQLSRNHKKPRQSIPGPLEIEIPVEETPGKYANDKAAGMSDWVTQKGNDAMGWMQEKLKSYGQGGAATTPAGVPWALPLWIGAGLGGGALGWTMTDKMLDKRRRVAMQQELEQAKQEYDDALFGKLSSVLDELYDNLQLTEKKATDNEANPYTLGNAAGVMGGAGLTYAGLTGLATALMTYNATKKRQRRSLLERAQKERQRLRFESQPSPIYAVPVPVARDAVDQDDASFQAAPSLLSSKISMAVIGDKTL